MKRFDFENLDVYQKALDFCDRAFSISKRFSREVQLSLGDQFRRAALSIANNIAEGSGRRHRAEKRQFFQTALSSAFECIPVLSIALRQNEMTEADHLSMYDSSYELCKMLSGLIKSVDRLPR